MKEADNNMWRRIIISRWHDKNKWWGLLDIRDGVVRKSNTKFVTTRKASLVSSIGRELGCFLFVGQYKVETSAGQSTDTLSMTWRMARKPTLAEYVDDQAANVAQYVQNRSLKVVRGELHRNCLIRFGFVFFCLASAWDF